MSDEIDREITSRKVTSTSNTPVNGYNVSEERSTRVTNDNSSSGVIVGVLLFLAVGTGAIVYFLNNRPTTTPIITPAVDTVRENKSTVIERYNTTIKEVSPAPTQIIQTTQPTPKVDITVQPQPVAPAPAPAVTITAQPTPTPSATPKATNPSATPTPTTGAPNN